MTTSTLAFTTFRKSSLGPTSGKRPCSITPTRLDRSVKVTLLDFKLLWVGPHPYLLFRSLTDRDIPSTIVDTFVRIRAAHEILSDPVLKIAYDRFGPDVVICSTCKTNRDFVNNGLTSYYPFYFGSGLVLSLMSVVGKGQFGRYWRFVVLFSMAALELIMVTRPEPLWILSWIMPNRVTFEQVIILHQIFVSSFIAISQIGPILVPSKEQEKSNTKELIDRLELLTAISSKFSYCFVMERMLVSIKWMCKIRPLIKDFLYFILNVDAESIGQLQSVFDVFRGDEECMTQLKRQMGMMALDSRLTQDQLLNETRNAVQRRLWQRKTA